jgi:Family of unknown function (DUF6294)
MNLKNWDGIKTGRRLFWMVLSLAIGLGRIRADTVPDFEISEQNPIIASGNGVEIRQSEFDQAIGPMQFEYLARGSTLPGYFSGAVMEHLIEYSLLLEKANDDDRKKGFREAMDDDVTNHINECGSLDQYNQLLDSLGITESDVLAMDKKADIAQAALVRLLGISINDTDAQIYYNDHPEEFRYPDGSLVEFTNIEAEIKHHLEDEQVIKLRPNFLHRLKDQGQIHIYDPDLLFAYNEFQLSQSRVALQAPAIVLPAQVAKSISFNLDNFQSGDGVIEHCTLTLRADGTAHWSAIVFTNRQNGDEVWQVNWDILDKDGVKLFSLPSQSGPRMYSGSNSGPPKYHWDVDFNYDAGSFDKIKHMTLHGSC